MPKREALSAAGAAGPAPEECQQHSLQEDAGAVLLGTLIVALGITIYREVGLLFGGIAGLALLLHYLSTLSFGALFVALNIPFFILAWCRMGPTVAARSVVAVALVAVFSAAGPRWIDLTFVHPVYAAVIGGGLCGVGMLMLFRHRTALGGINILALHVQERRGVRAGHLQLALDAAILAGAALMLTFEQLALSILGTIVLNWILATNHRTGRYKGIS